MSVDDNAEWGERSLVFIQVIEGVVTYPLGSLSLHDDVIDLDNLHMCGHKFKITLFLSKWDDVYINFGTLKKKNLMQSSSPSNEL